MPKSSFPPSKRMGKIVRDERIAAGCRTQKDLAERIGCFITPKSISLVESGKGGLSDAAAEKLMELFECDDAYLRGESKFKTAEARSLFEESHTYMNSFIDALGELSSSTEELARKWYAPAEEDLQTFLFDRMGWREIGYIGVLVKSIGTLDDDHNRIPWIVSADFTMIPEGMSFHPQYIVLESSDGRHVLHIGELRKYIAMLSDFIKSGLKNLERPLMTAPGWEDFTSQNLSIHPKTLLNFFDNEEWKSVSETIPENQEGDNNEH